MTVIHVTIPNWEKHNPRSDLRGRRSWFRLNNDVFFEPKLFRLTFLERSIWIFVLSQCSSSAKNGEVDLDVEWCEYMAKLPAGALSKTLLKLEELKVVQLRTDPGALRTGSSDECTDPGITNTVRTFTVRTNTIVQNGPKSGEMTVAFATELETLYRKYPKKVKKAEGMRRLRTSVRTKEDLANLELALEKFCEYHRREGTEARYVPLFSTFANSWKDWIDPDAGTVNGFDKPKYRPLSEVIAEAEREAANATA